MSILKDVDALFAEEKTLKKQVKDDSAALHQRTKGVIERLTDEEVRDLLHRKWILPLMENLNSLPDAVLDDFVKQLDVVCKKYETTFEGCREPDRQHRARIAGAAGRFAGK